MTGGRDDANRRSSRAAPPPGAQAPRRGAAWRALLVALALVPAVAGLAVWVSPLLFVSDAWGDAAAAALAVVPAVAALVLSARASGGSAASGPGRLELGVLPLGLGLAALALAASAGLPRALVPAQAFGLVAVAHVVGHEIGRRIAHPGHVLAAALVASAADVASVVSPEGATNAIARSDRALAWLALSTAVPGSTAVSFVLGVGDLVMLALLLGVAARFGVSLVRVGLLALSAFALALVASAVLRAPVPALVSLAIVVVAGVPAFRRVRPEDRKTTLAGLVIAAVVVAVVALRAR